MAFTTDEIAENLTLTRERVRQIRNKITAELFSKFQFIKNINDDLFQKYNIDLTQSYLVIDSDLNTLINQINRTNFSSEFISFIMFVFSEEHFELIGNLEDVLQAKTFNSRNRHNWNQFYLVNNTLSKEFDFNSLADNISYRLNERIEESYKFNLKSYVISFFKGDNTEILSSILPVVEKIINQEFELFVDLNDNIVFKRNTLKQVHEYAIEILERLGVPSRIEDIYKIIVSEQPNLTKNQDALRGSLQKIKEIICFGRSSTYGLKKWEREKEGIRGGTIRNIILEFLQDKDKPIHVFEIIKEVKKFRQDTNSKSILSNLKLDPHSQILVYNQSFLGLRHKNYRSNLINLPKFLGKQITWYVKKNNYLDINVVESKFAIELSIDVTDMGFIIQQLIENEFLHINEYNQLTI